jgi:hypothetical protein
VKAGGDIQLDATGDLAIDQVTIDGVSGAGLQSLRGGVIEVTQSGSAATLAVNSLIQTLNTGTITLKSTATDSVIHLNAGLSAQYGNIALTAGQAVEVVSSDASPTDLASLITNLAELTITATEGLNFVTSAGVFAAGVISRHSSAGALRIVGNQTLRDGQRIRIEIDSNNQPQSVEVTDTLALGNEAQQGVVATTVSNGLDVVWPAGFDPGSDAITLLTTGQVTGRFADATGLYGFTDGSTYLALTTEASGEITVSETLRPAASQLGIETHEKSDADTLGVFLTVRISVTDTYEVA